jgi:hypothetical protein
MGLFSLPSSVREYNRGLYSSQLQGYVFAYSAIPTLYSHLHYSSYLFKTLGRESLGLFGRVKEIKFLIDFCLDAK